MYKEAYSNASIEELPFIEVKDLCEDEIEFQVESVNIKENVETKFGTKTVAYVKIVTDAGRMIVSVKQDVLMKAFKALKLARDAGTDCYGADAVYKIAMPEDKNYYKLLVDVPGN